MWPQSLGLLHWPKQRVIFWKTGFFYRYNELLPQILNLRLVSLESRWQTKICLLCPNFVKSHENTAPAFWCTQDLYRSARVPFSDFLPKMPCSWVFALEACFLAVFPARLLPCRLQGPWERLPNNTDRPVSLCPFQLSSAVFRVKGVRSVPSTWLESLLSKLSSCVVQDLVKHPPAKHQPRKIIKCKL